MPFFEHGGAELYYEEEGCGKPLIFLHGASWDMRQWRTQIAYFSPMYRVITMDARGHGKSSLPPGSVSPDLFWQDVQALMDHLNIEKAILCGLSLGGHTALQMAIHAPGRVEGLILIGTPCTNQFNLYERICVPINRFCLRLMPMSWIAWCMCIPLGKYSPSTKDYIKDVVQALNHNAFNRVWKAVTSMESRDGLSSISCPTLLLIGDHDTMTGHQQQYIHKAILGSRLVTIHQAHHGTNVDNPTQVNGEITHFLQQMQG